LVVSIDWFYGFDFPREKFLNGFFYCDFGFFGFFGFGF